MLHNNQDSYGLTAKDLAFRIRLATGEDITERAIHKRFGIDRYLVGTRNHGGRPAKIYSTEALHLWRIDPGTIDLAKGRRGRSDHGAPRNCSPNTWQMIVEVVKGLYLSNAQPNLKLAVEHAEKQLRQQGVVFEITAKQIYKRLTCRNAAPDGLPISEFYRDNWEIVRKSGLRKKDVALSTATARYDWLSVFESTGWAGPGFGAMRCWSIDVRHADTWAIGSDGQPSLPSAVYIRCGLTGQPLWIEPIETESSETIIRAVLKCMLAWQRGPDIAFAIDNGKAMISERTLGVLGSIMPDEAWERAAQYPELFGAGASPILRNLPNIPRSPFKAALERSFKQIKDEFDATRFSRTYQGGDRSEAVQLRVSNRPSWQYLPAVLRDADTYFGGLNEWIYSDYVARDRPAMFPALVERGMTPTIAAAFQYYYDPTPSLPQGSNLAHVLYWALERKAIVKCELGYVDATIGGQFWHCVASELDHRYYGHKIAVLPIPDSDIAILMLADNPSDPRYIASVRNAYVRTLDQMREIRPMVRQVRNDIRDGLRDERQSVPHQDWTNIEPVGTMPQLPAHVEAWVDGEPLVVENIDHTTHLSPTQECDIDSVMRDIDTLLD